jgi:spore germination protein YaaH
LTAARPAIVLGAVAFVSAIAPARPAAFGVGALHAQALEALWYSTPGESSTRSFLAHADQISILSPQVFMFDRSGGLTGRIDPRVIAKAREQGVKLVPLVMNPGFDQPMMHHILTNPEARLKAIRSMTALCRDNGFAGIQFDIENVHVRYRDTFTSFARETADSLHAINCTLSAAVVPRINDDPGGNSYHRWIYENWRGVYDYKALAESMDFISYMTYAQHTGGSTAGPVAGYKWTKECLDYVLSLGVPPSKISLGLASYSDYWYPVYDSVGGSRMRGRDISYESVMKILADRRVVPIWDDGEKALRAEWSVAGVYESAWIEDSRAFMAKLELVKQYKLRGYSVWVLGMEDPKTWEATRAAGITATRAKPK